MKAVKMPTLLEGEALAAWIDLAEETKKDYETAKKQLMTYRRAHADRLYALGQISRQEITTGRVRHATTYSFIMDQFIAGQPLRVSRELRAAGETKELGVTLQRAQLLLSLEDQHQLTESGPLGSSTKQPNEREQAMVATCEHR